MIKPCYRLSTVVEKERNGNRELYTEIEELENDVDFLPPLSIAIADRLIAIRSHHRTPDDAEAAAADARRRWAAGKFDAILDALISEISGYKLQTK